MADDSQSGNLHGRIAALISTKNGSGELAIVDELLGSSDAGVKALLDTYHDAQPMVLRNAVLEEADKDSSVARIIGTVNYRNVDSAPVLAVFREADGGIDLRIRISLPATWRFSQSFPALPTSIDFRAPLTPAASPVLDLLTLSDAAFVLATRDHTDEPLGARLTAGLSFVARFRPAGLFGAVEHALGGTGEDLVIAGPILLPPPVPAVVPRAVLPVTTVPSPVPLPGINLTARLDVDADLGPVSLHDTSLRLYCPPDAKWLATHPERPPAVHFGGTISVEQFRLDVWALVPPSGDDFLVLTAEPEEGVAAFDLGALAGLFGQDDLAAQLTPQLGDLGEIALHSLVVSVSTEPPGLLYASVTIALDGVHWMPLGDVLEVTGLEAVFAVTNPLNADRRLSVLLAGSVRIEGADVTVTAEMPGFVITADAQDLPPIPLSSLMRTYLPDVPPVADLTVKRLQVAAIPGQSLVMSAFLASEPGAWTLDLGPQQLTVRDVGLSLGYVAGAGFTGGFSGRIGIAGVDLQLAYQVPGAFTLRADLPSISLRSLVEAMSDQRIPWPQGFDVVLQNSRVRIEQRGTDLALVLGTVVESFGSLALEVRRTGTNWGFAGGFALPDGFRMAQFSAELAPLDSVVTVRRLALVVASFDDPGFTFPDLSAFGDPALTSTRLNLPASAPGVKAGVNMFGELAFGGNRGLELIKSSLRVDRATLDLLVQIGENPANALLSAGISGSFNDNVHFTGALRIQLVEGTPSIGLLGQVAMEADGHPLRFTAELQIGPNGALLAGTMQGEWTDAFGIRGLTLADLALLLGISWELVPAIGIAGTISLGQFTGSAAVLFDGTMPSRSLLAGSISDLGMTDVIRTFAGEQVPVPPELAPVLDGMRLQGVPLFDIPASLAADLDTGVLTPAVISAFLTGGRIGLPPAHEQVLLTVAQPGQRWYLTDRTTLKHYGIRRTGDALSVEMQVQLYVAPQATLIGQLMFPQGLRLSADVSAFGLGGSVDLDVDPNAGISLDGSMTPIDEGVIFSLTGSGGRAGPTVSLATYDAPGAKIRGPHMVVSGAVTMLGFTRDIDLRASSDGFSLTVSASLFNAFEAAVTATAPLRDFTASDLVVAATMKNDLLTLIRTRGADAIRQAAADATAAIRDARTQVTAYQTQLRHIQAQIDAQLPQIRAERAAADAKLRKARSDVDVIQRQIDAEQREIKRLNREIDRLRGDANFLNGFNLGDLIARGSELAGHKIALGGEQASLATAQGVLEAAQGAVSVTPVELDPRVSGLYTQLGLTQGGLQGAQGVLDTTLAGVGGFAGVAEWITRNGPDVLDVTQARFEGRLGVVSGGAVHLEVAYRLLGQPGNTTVDFNFHDVERGLGALADLLKQQAGTLVAAG